MSDIDRRLAELTSERASAERVLQDARRRVMDTVRDELSRSSLSDVFFASYCSKCPCILIQRADLGDIAFRVDISEQNGSVYAAVDEGPWHPIGSNLDAVRRLFVEATATNAAKATPNRAAIAIRSGSGPLSSNDYEDGDLKVFWWILGAAAVVAALVIFAAVAATYFAAVLFVGLIIAAVGIFMK